MRGGKQDKMNKV